MRSRFLLRRKIGVGLKMWRFNTQKFVGIFFWIVFIIMAVELTLAVTGISIARFSEDPERRNETLYLTNYYGSPLSCDPYASYLLMCLSERTITESCSIRYKDLRGQCPLKAEGLPSYAINVRHDGNREGFKATGYQGRPLIVTGGSTTWGHFARSDRETVPWLLGNLLQISTENRGAPSFTSYQEYLSVLGAKPLAIIQLTGVNDIGAYCEKSVESRINLQFSGVEHFEKMDEALFNPSVQYLFKSFVQKYFPQLIQLRRDLIALWSYDETPDTLYASGCSTDDVPRIASIFENSVKLMQDYAKSVNAQHFCYIQPIKGVESVSEAPSLVARMIKQMERSSNCKYLGLASDHDYFLDMAHLNARGAERIASHIRGDLNEQGWFK